MTELNIQIEDLIEKKASDFEISKLFKSSIKEYLASIDNTLETTGGKEFFVQHTKKIDKFLIVLYKYILRKYFGSYLPMGSSIPITLIALGSYGREQLCIYSDIDLMILYENIPGYNLKPMIEEFITIAWDCGLKLGSRVHELNDVEACVQEDITIKTSMIESRMIYGSKYLWFGYQNLLNKIRKTNKQQFILEKLEEHKQRLLKYPLKMEPNIKDGYGGMREANMMFWMANVLYGLDDTKNLIDKHFSEEEYRKYRIALEFIFQVRSMLHSIAKKKLDQVNFDVLPELSQKLGFVNKPRTTKERQLMSKLFNSLHAIHFFTTIMIKKFTREIIAQKSHMADLKTLRLKKNLYLIDKKLFTSFHQKPFPLAQTLKELLCLPDTIEHFDRSYIYLISKTLLPNKQTNEHKKLIKALLFKSKLYPIVKLLYNANLFQTIIPSTKKIINLPQFDGYHQQPVDVHSINTLKFIEHIEDAFVLKIYEKLSEQQKSWAKIAALFHDIGKGRQTDHHIAGEKLFKNMARTLNFESDDTAMIARIIRYHNLMSMVATNEDIYSQKVILAFTANLKSQLALDILYVVTYADISAVGKHIYNSATASLLKELYLQSIQAFDNAELLNESARRVAKINSIKKLPKFKELSMLMKKKISYIASNQIFLQLKATEILELAIKAKDVENYTYKIINNDVLIIRIIRAVPLNLGYLLGKLEFLSIASMSIFKLFDDKKCFEVTFSENVDESDIPFIEEIIQNSFDMSKTTKLLVPEIYKEEIQIDCNHTQYLASMKVKTKDQKGLLAYIAKIFDDFNIEIESAKIYTSRGKARDLFLIEKNGNFCVNAEEIVDLICVHSKSNDEQF
ncbi:MAG: HD domain-containing protein [Arcobacteraceae bacterium]|nr:HD domain-containing protein [Arcobacteraceae bacterium]